MDLEFLRDIAAMSHDGIDRDIDFRGDLFVGQPLDYADNYIALSRGKFLTVVDAGCLDRYIAHDLSDAGRVGIDRDGVIEKAYDIFGKRRHV